MKTQLSAGDCDAAEATAQEIQASVEGIQDDVSDNLEEALVQASGNLASQARTQCEEPEPEPPEPPTGASGEEGVTSEDEG